MKQQMLDLVDEQFNLDKLLDEMCEGKTDEEILSAARKIVVFRNQGAWMKLKIKQLYEESK